MTLQGYKRRGRYWCLADGQSYKKGSGLRRTYVAEVGPQPTMPIENQGPVSAVHCQKQHQFPIKTVISILLPFCMFTLEEHKCICMEETRTAFVRGSLKFSSIRMI